MLRFQCYSYKLNFSNNIKFCLQNFGSDSLLILAWFVFIINICMNRCNFELCIRHILLLICLWRLCCIFFESTNTWWQNVLLNTHLYNNNRTCYTLVRGTENCLNRNYCYGYFIFMLVALQHIILVIFSNRSFCNIRIFFSELLLLWQ